MYMFSLMVNFIIVNIIFVIIFMILATKNNKLYSAKKIIQEDWIWVLFFLTDFIACVIYSLFLKYLFIREYYKTKVSSSRYNSDELFSVIQRLKNWIHPLILLEIAIFKL